MAKRRVLVVSPDPSDVTSFYRAHGPLAHLERHQDEFEFSYPPAVKDVGFDWTVFARIDVLFFQRPCLPSHVELIVQAKKSGVKVWVDYDDNLLAMPQSNPFYELYAQNTQAVIASLRHADAVSVSTKALIEAYSPFSKNIQVIPNAMMSNLIRKLPRLPDQEDKVILWRGTPTHIEDLQHYAGRIVEFHEKYPDWVWCFFGFNPWFITKHFDCKYVKHTRQDIPAYFDILQMIQPKIQVVALQDTLFNRAKSNIAWIEGTFAGAAVCLLSEQGLDEWDRPGITRGFDSLESLVQHEEIRESKLKQARDYIKGSLDIAHVNRDRYNLLQSLFAPLRSVV